MDIVSRPLGHEAQQCRTCVHSRDRLWDADLQEVLACGGDRSQLAQLECHPTKVEITRKIRRDGVLVSLREKDRPILERDIDPRSHSIEPVYVETCGIQLLPKCRRCARLRTVTVKIPHEQFPNSTKDVVISAACSIPAEGMVKDGRIVTCDPKPINPLAKIEPSCENCKFRFTTDENWQMESFTVSQADLTPYEMEQVRMRAGQQNVGRAINQARTAKAQAVDGRYRWYGVKLLGVHHGSEYTQYKIELPTTQQAVLFHDGTEITKYVLYRTPENLTVQLPSDVMRFHRLEGNKAALEIKLPWQAPFGLVDGPGGNDGTVKRVRRLPPPPERIGVEYRTDDKGRKHRIWHKSTKSYFESKRPIYNAITGQVELQAPQSEEDMSDTGLWRLHLICDDGTWKVVDDRFYWHKLLIFMCGATVAQADNGPHVTVFDLRLRSMLDLAKRKGGKKAWGDVLRQYHRMAEHYPLSRPIPTTPGIFRDINLEPFKEYCSLNLADPNQGIDFRELFGDSFGLDRTSYSRTWAYEMERDQWYRATHAGNEVHGEIIRNEMLDPAWPERTPSDEDKWERLRQQAKRIVLDAFGNEIDDPSDLSMADRVADTQAYLQWLDEPVERVTESGVSVWEDRRMQVHGYTMYRGSRLEATPNFVLNEAGDSVRDSLYCRECDKAIPLTEINDDDEYLPKLDCPDCGAELFVGRSGGEPATWVRMGKRVGIGTAIAADSESFLNRQRLRSTVCPSWRFRYNPNINYDMVLAQRDYVEPIKPELDKAVEDINEFEYLGIDTRFVGGSTVGGYLDRQ